MTLSEREAYVAMFQFLDAYWERNGKPDELGSLLGSMALLEDGSPADSAMWEDWLEAINNGRSGSLPGRP